MWPLLLILLLASTGGKATAPKSKPDDGADDPDKCYDVPYQWDGPPLLKLPDLNKYGMTAGEKSSMVAVFAAVRDALPNKLPLDNATENFCRKSLIVTAAETTVDDFGALAMLVYWGATKSKQVRPYPDMDLEVMGMPPVMVDGKEVSMLAYCKQRIALFKSAMLASTMVGQAAQAAFNPVLKSPPHKSGLLRL